MGTPPASPAPPRLPGRSKPGSAEAPPGSLDGAVMEGPLFSESAFRGQGSVGRVTEPHPSWRWATEPKRREGARGR